MKKLQVGFYVSGHVWTEVEVPDDMTIQELQIGLNSGKYLTSIIPGSPVTQTEPDFDEIGKVVEMVEPNCEYTDFEVKELDNE
jgi:hypothetical protein